jgi:hypothetical protein
MRAFLTYSCFMIWAIIASRRKAATLSLMVGSWLVAWLLLIPYGDNSYHHAAAVARWGVPTFLIPTIVGSFHAWSTRRNTTGVSPPPRPAHVDDPARDSTAKIP